MTQEKKFRLSENDRIIPCPDCGNNTDFRIKSRTSGEDCHDIWIECQCGYDPTADDEGFRLEDVICDLGSFNQYRALLVAWNEPLMEEEQIEC